MSKQPLKFSLNPTAIAMLERILPNCSRAVLTRNQIAEVLPLRQALFEAREKMNLMARSEIAGAVGDFDVYPHPDHRAAGKVMLYHRINQDLLINTPFDGIPSDEQLSAWMTGQA